MKTNPRDPWAAAQPPGTKIAAAEEAPKGIVDSALAVIGHDMTFEKVNATLLAAVIIAQALDRASKRMIDAAAVGSYKRS